MSDQYHSEEAILIAKHFSGETTAAEEEALLKWIALSETNQKLYDKYKRLYDTSGEVNTRSAADVLDINIDQEWDRFVTAAEQSENTIKLKLGAQPLRWLKIAAAFTLLIASGVVINYWLGINEDSVYQTAENTKVISMPDGSVVSLNRNSTLMVSGLYAEKNRSVKLSGEAFFEVTPDKEIPFTIELSDAEVTVLGTSFSVKNTKHKNEVEVIVETGVVTLKPKAQPQFLELKAGEKGIYRIKEDELISSANSDVNFLSWKTKKITFNDSDLKSVVQTLQATYGVIISISTEVSADCVVNVTFDNQSLEAVLNILQSTLDLTYKREANRIEITRAGC